MDYYPLSIINVRSQRQRFDQLWPLVANVAHILTNLVPMEFFDRSAACQRKFSRTLR